MGDNIRRFRVRPCDKDREELWQAAYKDAKTQRPGLTWSDWVREALDYAARDFELVTDS